MPAGVSSLQGSGPLLGWRGPPTPRQEYAVASWGALAALLPAPSRRRRPDASGAPGSQRPRRLRRIARLGGATRGGVGGGGGGDPFRGRQRAARGRGAARAEPARVRHDGPAAPRHGARRGGRARDGGMAGGSGAPPSTRPAGGGGGGGG